MKLSRIDRIIRTYTMSAVLAGGGPAVIAGVDVALLAPRSTPTAATVWRAATSYAAGVATVLLVGPDADPTGALVVPATADLWMRVTDAPEVEAVFVERITVAGSSTQILPDTLDALVAALLANPTSATRAQAIALPNYPQGA